MENIFLLIIIILVIFILSLIEYKEYRSILTPFNVLVWPYLLIVLYVNLFAIRRGYFPVTIESIFFVGLNAIVFWLVGQNVWLFIRPKKYTRDFSERFKIFIVKNRTPLLFILWIAILASVIQFVQIVAKIGIKGISGEVFEKTYGYGILGHLAILGYPSFILLSSSCFIIRDKIVELSILFMGIVILASQVKYHLILPVVAIFYFLVLSKIIKKSIVKPLCVVIILIFVIFYLSYFISFSARFGYRDTLKLLSNFIIEHVELYLIGGPIALGVFLDGYEYSLSWKAMFQVPINIYRWLSGSHNFYRISENAVDYVSIGDKKITNVGTMFEIVYRCIGFQGSILFMVVLGILVYVIYNLALKRKTIFLLLLSSWLLSILTLCGFFGYYFNLLMIFEVSFDIIFILFLISVYQSFNLQFIKIKRHIKES